MDRPTPVVGIQVFPGDGFIRPVDLGRAVEDRGFGTDITVAVGYGRDLTPAEFDKLRAAQVTRILLAIKPASYEETTAALDEAAPIAK